MRVKWGCDAPTANAQLLIPCVRCGGLEDRCDVCQGLGFEGIHRCPRTFDLGQSFETLWCVAQYPGALPCAGGLRDQPAPYIAALCLVQNAEPQLAEPLNNGRE